MFKRSSGLLLHITSLPGSHGIGDLGSTAHEFVELLDDCGQHIWQVLPLGPAGGGNSPYDSRSSFAGNPLLISIEGLVAVGLLGSDDLSSVPQARTTEVQFRRVSRWKRQMLERAHNRFCSGRAPHLRDEFERFCVESVGWLEDFATYQAIREQMGGKPWFRWEETLRKRRPDELSRARNELADLISFHRFEQFLFEHQWDRLRRHCRLNRISLMGDVPIYVALDSADAWASQDLFLLTPEGRPRVQAGVPPDLFSETGQLWGNPVYDWERMREDNYAWWLQRVKRVLHQTDIVRIDHFRGFAAGWQVPADHTTAIKGEWVPGPGRELFETLERELGSLPVVVEDLGVITPDVEALRDSLGFPGMKVLQFAFDGEVENPYLPHNFAPNSMVYTGTHDNDTAVGWLDSLPESVRRRVQRYSQSAPGEEHLGLIRLALSSVSVLSCVPVQDVLGLGSQARMNVPGRARGNWHWRVTDFEGLRRQSETLHELSELYGRLNSPLPLTQ